MLEILFALSLCQEGPAPLTTHAERTGYQETSSYADVMALLEELGGRPHLRVEFLGESAEGHRIPLVIAANPPDLTPDQARAAGKVVVYVQANIHGGEVEGKEAVQRFLIDLAPDDPRLERMVLLFTPIYNIDGNDAFGDGVEHRPSQNGPARVGQRPNGQGLDLNRDCIKAESPEMQALLRHVYVPWDPHVVLDLHTTNGTRHGFVLTYSPPLNPNTEAGVLDYSREVLLPEVRRRAREVYGLEMFDYGNVFGEGDAWVTFGHEGRYVTNYVGLRNRIGLLSEAVSYATFEDRVHATRVFVDEVLGFVARNAEQVRAVTAAADRAVAAYGAGGSTAELAVEFDFADRGQEEVPLEVEDAQAGRRDPVTRTRLQELRIVDRFVGTRSAPVPQAYAFASADVARLLVLHGVRVERLEEPWTGSVTRLVIDGDEVARRPFQGHRLHRLTGTFTDAEETLAAGTFLVRMDQALGVLAFHLLEPQGPDGALAWERFGDTFEAGARAPVGKLFHADRIPAVAWH